MANLPEGYENPTPGLSDAVKFWGAIRIKDASAAKSHAEVLVKLELLDRETKAAVVNALAELRQNKREKPGVEAEDVPRKEMKLRIIPSSPPQWRDPSLESKADYQLRVLNSILDSLKKENVEEALKTYTELPHQNDRAKVLCALISSKVSEVRASGTQFYPAKDVAAREGIPSLSLSVDTRKRVISELFKIYFDKLNQN